MKMFANCGNCYVWQVLPNRMIIHCITGTKKNCCDAVPLFTKYPHHKSSHVTLDSRLFCARPQNTVLLWCSIMKPLHCSAYITKGSIEMSNHCIISFRKGAVCLSEPSICYKWNSTDQSDSPPAKHRAWMLGHNGCRTTLGSPAQCP